MPPKKKQAPRTGFYYYMLEVWDDFEVKLGYKPRMDKLKELAGPGWSALSADERLPYNTLAKEQKATAKKDLDKKYNSLGVAFSTLEAEEREKREEESIMKATILSIVTDKSIEVLRTVRFYFSHVNWYYSQFIDQEYWHCPCEISIIEFTLLDGITGKFHKILDPGELPLGVRADVKERAEKYHDIHLSSKPGKPAPLKESNMLLVFQQVVGFLRRGGTQGKQGREVLPPIFTMPNSVNHNHSLTAVKNALQKFSEASHERRDLFRVFPLPPLFFELKLKIDLDFKSDFGPAILETELENDLFVGTADFECEYHQESENGRYCSQAVAMRWAYTVMDHLCAKAGVKLIPGKHSPAGAQPSSFKVNTRGWDAQGDTATPDPWSVDSVKIKDLNIRRKEEVEEQLKQAENLSLPSSRSWKDVPSAKQSDDGWTSVPSRGQRTPRGWNTVAAGPVASGQDTDSDFPTSSGFPALTSAAAGAYHRGLPRPRSDVSGSGENMRQTSTKPVIGRGKMFERH